MSDDRRDLFSQVEIGIEAEAFLASSIGKYLVSRAEAEIDRAVEALKIINPTDAANITTLQTRIYRAASVQYWLVECIQASKNAVEVLERLDHE